MKAALEGLDPLDELAAARTKLGAWRGWTFERQVWYLRRMANLTQRDLSALSGVSQHRISRIEAGADVKLSTLAALWRPMGWQPMIIPDRIGLEREGMRYRKTRTMSRRTSSVPRETDDVPRDISRRAR
ncbi:MAG: helix-turn-helix domain-containing protein [Elusimicrobiota bacterium]|nr:MAG: helix-turn-helix domain-containing protein [Elusimicrobiota bacterium]